MLGPAERAFKARVIGPSEVGTLTRGTGSNARHVRNILPEDAEAESLLVVEVSRPPATGRATRRTGTTATRCRRILSRGDLLPPPQAAAGLRVPARLYRRPLARRDAAWRRHVVLVPGLSPGRRPARLRPLLFNVMAGPKRVWRFHNDPAHEWMIKADGELS